MENIKFVDEDMTTTVSGNEESEQDNANKKTVSQ